LIFTYLTFSSITVSFELQLYFVLNNITLCGYTRYAQLSVTPTARLVKT